MTQSIDPQANPTQGDPALSESHPLGAWLVFGAAVVWSLGGILARLADMDNAWATIFWRSGTAALCLLAFMLLRDGRAGTLALFSRMGAAGLAVAACFTVATTSFVVALQFTTVANVLVMRMAAWRRVITVAVMVSDSLTGRVSPLGDGLALLIACAFATATVITRRHAAIRMTPAVCTGAAFGCGIALAVNLAAGTSVAVEAWQFGTLAVFGMTLGLGMALFTQGARLIPSAFAALLSTAETILGPLWVWLFVDETPTPRTLIGGGIVLAAIVGYLIWQLSNHRKIRRLAPPAL